MSLPPRISAVTLACRDIGRMAAFYRQFGWPEAPTSVPEHVVFQCTNGIVLGLFSDHVYEAQFGGVSDGFRGVTFTIHCEDAAAVQRVHEEIVAFDDVSELEPAPRRSGFGAGFSFRDPEGNVWDVAWKAGGELDDRGRFTYP